MRTIPENPQVESSEKKVRPRIGKFVDSSTGNRKARKWFICLECGKSFSINNSDADKRLKSTNAGGLFCNRTCYTAWRIKQGEKKTEVEKS